MAQALLALRQIIVCYDGHPALRIDALDVQPREVLAILGPNGAGKSTLLRIMGLLQRPDQGRVSFSGVEAERRNGLALRRRIGTVFQEPLLLNESVFQNAALGLRLRGIAPREIVARLNPWLERLGIDHLANRRARSLSGGEAQRTSLARALVLEPELLLLDEPFSALDPASRETLLRDFERIVRELKITAVMVSHERRECFELAQRIGVMHEGRLLQLASAEEVFFRPGTEAVAKIVGAENRLPGVVQGVADGLVAIGFDDVLLYARGHFKAGASVIVCVRPEEIALAPGSCRIGGCNQFRGKIVEVSAGIDSHRMVLHCGSLRLIALVPRTLSSALGLSTGDDALVSFSPSAVHVIEVVND